MTSAQQATRLRLQAPARSGAWRLVRANVIHDSQPLQFLSLLTVAILIRCSVWGEWNFDVDEQFYFLVGHRLLEGARLYVDIWDRKGPATFLIFSALASVWPSVMGFHIAATLFAALGGYGVNRMARLIAPAGPALLAGIAYLALIGRFGGAAAQAQVFYNPLMIAAAWSIASRIKFLRQGRIDMRVAFGMLCGGIAITFKLNAAFECIFFGGFVCVLVARTKRPLASKISGIALLALLGVAPTLMTVLYYALTGHFAELWQAQVLSNFGRQYSEGPQRIERIAVLAGMLGMPLAFAALGYFHLIRSQPSHGPLAFVGLWALASMVGMVLYPNVFPHYALPLIAPLCVLSAGFFMRGTIGIATFGATVIMSLIYGHTLDLPARQRAHAAQEQVSSYLLAQTPDRTLLVWGMPSYLYHIVGARPLSALAFPAHLYSWDERGTSGRDEVLELRRTLALRPASVVEQVPLEVSPLNEANMAQVRAYLRTCRQSRPMMLYDHNGPQPQVIWTHCGGK